MDLYNSIRNSMFIPWSQMLLNTSLKNTPVINVHDVHWKVIPEFHYIVIGRIRVNSKVYNICIKYISISVGSPVIIISMIVTKSTLLSLENILF